MKMVLLRSGGNSPCRQYEVALQSHPVYALEADLAARGINNLIEGIQVINYDGFVELVEQHNVIPWLRS